MDIQFCRRCGTPTTQVTNNQFTCKNEHQLFAYNPAAIGLFLVNAQNEVLLATRGSDPGKGMLDVPGGFVDLHENLEQAVEREITEELHLSSESYGTPQYICSGLNDYQFGGELVHPIDIFFWARTKGNTVLQPDDDVSAVHWHALAAIDLNDIAFKTVRHALGKLKTHLV